MKVLFDFLQNEYGIRADVVEPMFGGLVNTNLRVDSPSGIYVFKQYNQKSLDEVRFETDILQSLAGSNVPSPRLVQLKSSDVIGSFDGKPCVLYRYLSGIPIESVNRLLLKKIGIICANIHVSLLGFNPSVKKSTWELYDLKELVASSRDNLSSRGYQNSDELCSFVQSELEQFNFSDNLPKGITHQDIKPENVLIDNNSITGILDFDNSYYGTFLDDITTTIIWTCFKEYVLNYSYVDALLEGYESVRMLATNERESLSERIRFRLLREVFISPYAATHPQQAYRSSEYFKILYKKRIKI